MKNKKLLFILMPLVVIIWGLVIYRVAASLEGPDSQPLSGAIPAEINSKEETVPDTFRLALGYRDPFLAGRPIRKTEVGDPFVSSLPEKAVQHVPIAAQRPIAEPVQVAWPLVEYSGLIENRAKKTRVAMLRIGDEDFLLSEGESAGNVKLSKILPDSVLLIYQKEKKYVRK